MLRSIALCLLSAVVLVGCRTLDDREDVYDLPPHRPGDIVTPPPPGGDEGIPPEQLVSTTGTVRYIDLEGGFYGIVARDSVRYDPLDLDDEFQVDGLAVRFRGRLRTDVMTVRQWGRPLEILEIASVEGIMD